MSAAKENPCRKFQTNIFNRSKYQNCFKPHESHLLNDEDLRQVSHPLFKRRGYWVQGDGERPWLAFALEMSSSRE
uniref:Uncharacterized protein n=1 Tax=Piliocolobus tephrosceles TaxID=591936 RepID=A0A8C9LYI2_9PRIM